MSGLSSSNDNLGQDDNPIKSNSDVNKQTNKSDSNENPLKDALKPQQTSPTGPGK